MALNPIPIKEKTSGGRGGLWGAIGGGILGALSAAAAPFTAGTSLAALPAAAGLVAGAAPVIGAALDPLKAKGGSGASMLDAAKALPEVQILQLNDAKKAIAGNTEISSPEANKYMGILDEARGELMNRLKIARG